MIRAIIIDDEPGAIQVLERLIEEFIPEVKVEGRAQSVKEGVNIIKLLNPDLIFLDIRLPDGDGFEVLEQTKGVHFEVVFTTAYNDYREQAFDYFALHYLTKPIDLEKLEKTIERYKKQKTTSFNPEKLVDLKERYPAKSGKIPLPVKDGYVLIDSSDIVRCEATSNYTKVFLTNGKAHIVAKTLKHFEELLSGNNFFRLHKSHLVNTQFIKEIKSDGSVTLTNDDRVVVSQRTKKAFFDFLKNRF